MYIFQKNGEWSDEMVDVVRAIMPIATHAVEVVAPRTATAPHVVRPQIGAAWALIAIPHCAGILPPIRELL